MTTQKSEMKLLGNGAGLFVIRVKLALEAKSIDYEFIEEDLNNKSELLLKSSPVFQQLPVLFHGNEQPMIESLVIMDYLDEIKPDVRPFLPSSPSERAQCRIFAHSVVDSLCYPAMYEFMITQSKERRAELKSLIIQQSVMLEEAFVKFSKGKPFLGGDDIGYLDIVVGSFLGWIKFYAKFFKFNVIEKARNPNLEEWGKRMWSHEVGRSVIPDHEAHKNSLKDLLRFRNLPSLPEHLSD